MLDTLFLQDPGKTHLPTVPSSWGNLGYVFSMPWTPLPLVGPGTPNSHPYPPRPHPVAVGSKRGAEKMLLTQNEERFLSCWNPLSPSAQLLSRSLNPAQARSCLWLGLVQVLGSAHSLGPLSQPCFFSDPACSSWVRPSGPALPAPAGSLSHLSLISLLYSGPGPRRSLCSWFFALTSISFSSSLGRRIVFSLWVLQIPLWLQLSFTGPETSSMDYIPASGTGTSSPDQSLQGFPRPALSLCCMEHAHHLALMLSLNHASLPLIFREHQASSEMYLWLGCWAHAGP